MLVLERSGQKINPICRDCNEQINSSPVYCDADTRLYVCGHCYSVNAFSLDLVN